MNFSLSQCCQCKIAYKHVFSSRHISLYPFHIQFCASVYLNLYTLNIYIQIYLPTLYMNAGTWTTQTPPITFLTHIIRQHLVSGLEKSLSDFSHSEADQTYSWLFEERAAQTMYVEITSGKRLLCYFVIFSPPNRPIRMKLASISRAIYGLSKKHDFFSKDELEKKKNRKTSTP